MKINGTFCKAYITAYFGFISSIYPSKSSDFEPRIYDKTA